MTHIMSPYHQLLRDILAQPYVDGRNAQARALFGYFMRFDLDGGAQFPLLSSRRIPFRRTIAELVWFLSGSTSLDDLNALGCHWWDEYAGRGPHPDEVSELGPIYGHQWRNLEDYRGGSLDQIRYIIEEVRNHNESRRAVMTAWRIDDLADMALQPCHVSLQIRLMRRRLHGLLYQRSADMILGVPHNIASYALLLCLISRELGVIPGSLCHAIGDAHIYRAHEPIASELVRRFHEDPREAPQLVLSDDLPDDIDDAWEILANRMRDGGRARPLVDLVGYNPHPPLHAELFP